MAWIIRFSILHFQYSVIIPCFVGMAAMAKVGNEYWKMDNGNCKIPMHRSILHFSISNTQ
jgi:hypothetical protein